jgi:endonuclease YncB( thermonuclease family)
LSIPAAGLTSFARNTAGNNAKSLSFNLFTPKGVFFRKDAFFIGSTHKLRADLGVVYNMCCGLVLWLASIAAACASDQDSGCLPSSIDAYARVETVIDGDTIRLTDRTLVRLVGINTPEIGYDGAASQPLAHSARKILDAELRKHERIGLVFGAERRDRHGRQLAHVFVDEGSVYRNVQQRLLEQGLAFWVAVAPNTHFLACYQAAEAKAVRARLGVWQETFFQPKNAAQAEALTPGFQLLRGTVAAVFETKNYFWLKFNNTVALRIAHKDMHNFQRSQLTAFKGKTVIARGWMFNHKNRLTMQISHPASITAE